MRKLAKFKFSKKTILFFRLLESTRLLKFKRPKWKKVQQRLKSSQTTKGDFFYDISTLSVDYKHWFKIKSTYSLGLLIKTSLCFFFDQAVVISSNDHYKLTKYKSISKQIIHLLIKPLFRIDILLWKLSFFKSPYEAKQAIDKKQIVLNNKLISKNNYVNAGDILHIHLSSALLQPNKKCISDFFFSFLEIDYYTGTVVILKDINFFTEKEVAMIIRENFNVKTLIDYILK